jgi:hypothetical protein
VRYTQLKRAEEKLCQDMEMCVMRRDSILENASFREQKRAKGSLSYNKLLHNKKMQDMANKLKRTRNVSVFSH